MPGWVGRGEGQVVGVEGGWVGGSRVGGGGGLWRRAVAVGGSGGGGGGGNGEGLR